MPRWTGVGPQRYDGAMRLGRSVAVVAVGRLKEPFWSAAQAEYAKRLRRYVSFDVVEVRDRHGRERSDTEARRLEADALLETAGSFWVALTPAPRVLDTEAFALQLQRWLDAHRSVRFLIGGPSGLAPELVARAPAVLSLSALTFPHELARIILLEQLYRGFSRLNGEPYHR